MAKALHRRHPIHLANGHGSTGSSRRVLHEQLCLESGDHSTRLEGSERRAVVPRRLRPLLDDEQLAAWLAPRARDRRLAGTGAAAVRIPRAALRSTGIQHVDLVVSSVERSLPFYRDLLGPLGWRRVQEVEGRTRRDHLVPERGLAQASAFAPRSHGARPLDRYEVGLHHLCFEAVSRPVVDERADWLQERGVEIESGPREYGYIPGYYTVFFFDPDGIKLEIVHVPGQAA